jgi:hypothetical protein
VTAYSTSTLARAVFVLLFGVGVPLLLLVVDVAGGQDLTWRLAAGNILLFAPIGVLIWLCSEPALRRTPVRGMLIAGCSAFVGFGASHVVQEKSVTTMNLLSLLGAAVLFMGIFWLCSRLSALRSLR